MNVELEDGELESDDNLETAENFSETKEEQAIDNIIKEIEVENMREELLKKMKKQSTKTRSHVSPAKKRKTHGKPKTFDFPPIRFFNSEPLVANLDLLKPPPPPPPIVSSMKPENTDDYASVDMELEDDLTDVEVPNDTSIKKKDSLVSQNETKKRKNIENELDDLQRKVKSIKDKIDRETHSLDRSRRENEKLFNEQERIREKHKRNKLKIKQQKDKVLKLYGEEKELELRIRILKCEKIEKTIDSRSPEYVENDENEWEDFDRQMELRNKKITEVPSDDVARIVSEDVSEKVHISEQLEQKEPTLNDEKGYDDENELRAMLLLTLGKTKSAQPLESPKVAVNPIEKGRNLLSRLCKYDMNGICRLGISCKSVHLSTVQVDERLLLDAIFRYIFEYSDEDIGDMTVLQCFQFYWLTIVNTVLSIIDQLLDFLNFHLHLIMI